MIQVHAIPAFQDNYIWLIHQSDNNDCIVVDPGDDKAVEQYLAQHDFNLTGILITHHHWDHTDGIEGLTQSLDIPVYGPEKSEISGITQPLKDNDQIKILGCSVQIFETPGHTLDHIVYIFDPDTAKPKLFCGDTLFSAGCGRLFEGSAVQMQASMDKLKQLPETTEVYCTHEYTQSNLRFALAVEPDNKDISTYREQIERLRQQDRITLPSTIATELKINPYLRTSQRTVISAAESYAGRKTTSNADVLGVIRQWKDNFQ